MNIDTGEIKRFFNEKELQEALKNNERLVEVNENDMTEKQKLNNKVSLHDNKSKLGKKRIKERKIKNPVDLTHKKGAFGICKYLKRRLANV